MPEALRIHSLFLIIIAKNRAYLLKLFEIPKIDIDALAYIESFALQSKLGYLTTPKQTSVCRNYTFQALLLRARILQPHILLDKLLPIILTANTFFLDCHHPSSQYDQASAVAGYLIAVQCQFRGTTQTARLL